MHRVPWALALTLALAPHAAAQELVTRLTVTGARNGQSAWTPSGDRIAFVSNRSGAWELWAMPGSGGEATQLTFDGDPVGWPAWTADGRALLYYARVAEGHRIFRLAPPGARERVPGLVFEAFRPLPSPDGERLLFDRFMGAPGANHDVFVREPSGALSRLTDDPGYDSDARWSPDGHFVAFHSDRGAERFQTQVWISRSDGTEPRGLTTGPEVNGYPSWSPNGRCLVHTSERDGHRDLWVVGHDGADPRRLTVHPGFDSDPVWRPNGGAILFTTDRFGGQELALLAVNDDLAGRCETAATDEPPFAVSGPAFFALRVADDSAAAAWYARAFGLERRAHLVDPGGRFSIHLLASVTLTVEIVRPRDLFDSTEPSAGHFKAGVFVDDVEAAFRWFNYLEARTDARIVTDERLGVRTFVVRDPEGNRIQLFESCGARCGG